MPRMEHKRYYKVQNLGKHRRVENAVNEAREFQTDVLRILEPRRRVYVIRARDGRYYASTGRTSSYRVVASVDPKGHVREYEHLGIKKGGEWE